jgi:hypothetical protein
MSSGSIRTNIREAKEMHIDRRTWWLHKPQVSLQLNATRPSSLFFVSFSLCLLFYFLFLFPRFFLFSCFFQSFFLSLPLFFLFDFHISFLSFFFFLFYMFVSSFCFIFLQFVFFLFLLSSFVASVFIFLFYLSFFPPYQFEPRSSDHVETIFSLLIATEQTCKVPHNSDNLSTSYSHRADMQGSP